jgi:rhomboid family GlyGly-CTERM serine protease
MAALNLGLFLPELAWTQELLEWAQFDRNAVAGGELGRLLSAHLVHWSREHFLLNLGVFCLLGILYERRLGKLFPWLLLACGSAVGLSVLVLAPEFSIYRGFSGVDSGLFLAALALEGSRPRSSLTSRLLIGTASVVFLTKLAFEGVSGEWLFTTTHCGDLGEPVPVAHISGALAAAACLGLRWIDLRFGGAVLRTADRRASAG